MKKFDKQKFAKLINLAIGTERSLNQFALNCDISSAHISRLSRALLDTPPHPEVLEKIANASQERVTYKELMCAAGYIDDELVEDTIKDSDLDIAFYEGYKDLNEEDKEVMRSTLEAFLKKNKNKKK